jgi:hypothetical protein
MSKEIKNKHLLCQGNPNQLVCVPSGLVRTDQLDVSSGRVKGLACQCNEIQKSMEPKSVGVAS